MRNSTKFKDGQGSQSYQYILMLNHNQLHYDTSWEWKLQGKHLESFSLNRNMYYALQDFCYTDSKPVSTPFDANIKHHVRDSEPLRYTLKL